MTHVDNPDAQEQWSAVLGFEGLYEASTLGRVRNIAPRRGTYPGRILKERKSPDGYLKVLLRNGKNNRSAFIHRVVYEAHTRSLMPSEEIDHLDGKPDNNRLSNLDAVSRLENMRRAFQRGRKSARGEAQGRARFTAEEVISIRQRVRDGELQNKISEEFGVTPTAINCIIKRHTWKHLP